MEVNFKSADIQIILFLVAKLTVRLRNLQEIAAIRGKVRKHFLNIA